MTARAIVVGAGGRMGRTVLALAGETAGIDVVFGADPLTGNSLASAPPEADVVIDFSTALALPETLGFCVSRGLPLILATTGHTTYEAVEAAAGQIAILASANLSLGALVLSRLAREARRLLAGAYDVTILETHHRAKKDAPSGTAKMLAAAMDAPGPAVTTLSIRGGGVFGTHEVRFLGDMDVVTLRHEAIDRRLFAKGALEAAKWIVGRTPGLYKLDDVYA